MLPSIHNLPGLGRRKSTGPNRSSFSGSASNLNSVEKVYHMLTPKPKTLLAKDRELVKHGELIYFSPNTMSKKPRYFFLFNDCLLITKRTGQNKFLLRLWMYLRPGVKIYSMPDSPNYEFRILVPVKGSVKTTKQRRLIMYGKNREQKEAWVNALAHWLWVCSGKQGPDPAAGAGFGEDNRHIKEKAPELDEDDMNKEDGEKEKPKGRKSSKASSSADHEDDDDHSFDSNSEGEDPAIEETKDDHSAGGNLLLFDPFPQSKTAPSSSSAPSAPPSVPQHSTSAGSSSSGSSDLLTTDVFGMQPFSPSGGNTTTAGSAPTANSGTQGGVYGGVAYPGYGAPGQAGTTLPQGYPTYPYGPPGAFMGPGGIMYSTGVPGQPGQPGMYGYPGYPYGNPFGMNPVGATNTSSPPGSGGASSGTTSASVGGSGVGAGGVGGVGGTSSGSYGSDPYGLLSGGNTGYGSAGIGHNTFGSTYGVSAGTGTTGVGATGTGSGSGNSTSNGGYGDLFSTSLGAPSGSGAPSGTTGGVGTSGALGNNGYPSSTPSSTEPTMNLDTLAQDELLQATRMIEEITRNLESRPRRNLERTNSTDRLTAELTPEDISEGILDAAGSISHAAAVLLKAAAAAQKERISREITVCAELKKPYHSDPLWAQGLISAARYVVAATQNLVITAESAVKGSVKEESLVAASQAVTAATAQLVAAQRAKGDVNSAAHMGLENAAKGITRATAQLVHSAQIASQHSPVQSNTASPQDMSRYSMTEKEVMKLEKKAKVMELEKETERLRLELEALNKKDYNH